MEVAGVPAAGLGVASKAVRQGRDLPSLPLASEVDSSAREQREEAVRPLVEAAEADGEWVSRLQAGELAALGEVYDAHHRHVRAFARRLLGDEAAAEDLLQETFLALPNAVRRFRGDATLRTFLISIAINHARHFVRSSVRRRAGDTRLQREPPPSSPNPEDATGRAEVNALVAAALQDLPIEQRVAIVLCEVEGRTSAEAARIVGVPEGTIRTRIFHGKRKLREALQRAGIQ